MKKSYSLFLFLIVVLVSCNKTSQLNYTEKRLVGSWFYTNVDFTPRWGFKKDITKDYFGQIISFSEDFTMTIEDSQQGTSFSGVWQLNQVNSYSAQSKTNSWNQQVIASYDNTQTGNIVQLVWDQISVSKNRINAQTSTDDGYYTIQLKKF